jgi:ABC-2 type transport system permease protein
MFFFSKSTVQIALFILTVLPVYYLSFNVLKLPLACSFWMLLLFTLAFALALHATGTLVSSFARTSVNSTRFGMIIAVPSFILCGYTWPLEAMPQIVQQVVKVLPQTWFFQGINYLTFKDPGWTFMAPFFSALLVIAALSYAAAALIASRS